MAEQRADAFVAEALEAVSPWGLRVVSGAIVAAAGLAGAAVPLLASITPRWVEANALLGIGIPSAFGGFVALYGAWIARSDLEGDLAVAIAVWWFLGTAFGAFSALGLVAFQLTAGVELANVAVVVSGLGSIGGVGGLIVGRYDVRSQRRRRELADERERLADEREKLALLNRIVRHDIGNDLQILSGMSSHLEGHVDASGQPYLERIQRTTEEAIELTEQVRTFVQTLDEDGASMRRRISLERVVATQIDNTREIYREATVSLDGEIPDVAVNADELLSTVFHNLLSNAIEHNDHDTPAVEVSVDRTDEGVAVSIADDGPGMPDEVRERVQTFETRSDNRVESGLGLYIVGMLVDRYGGDVTVSDREPRGTVVTVTLPVADGDD